MLTPRQKLEGIYVALSENLHEFIALSDSILKRAASRPSFLDIIFNRPVPFADFARRAGEVHDRWSMSVQGLETDLRSHLYGDLTPEEQHVYDMMVEWAKQVADAARILRDNQARFFASAQSLRMSTLTLEETTDRMAAYNAAQIRYHQSGTRLADLYHALPLEP